MEITKTILVTDKNARLGLRPKKGNLVVQKDVHERFLFDGEFWRLYSPGTKRHWKMSGKPEPSQLAVAVGSGGEKKKNLTWIIVAIVALAIIGTLLINA